MTIEQRATIHLMMNEMSIRDASDFAGEVVNNLLDKLAKQRQNYSPLMALAYENIMLVAATGKAKEPLKLIADLIRRADENPQQHDRIIRFDADGEHP